MKKSMKLIAMLTVIALLAGILATAIADDKIFTSTVYSIPKDRVDQEMLQQYAEQNPQTEETGETDAQPEEKPEETLFEEEEAEEAPADGTVERKVLIKSSRKEVVIEGEIITLYSKLVGFDDVEVHYQWQVDRGDGEGWVNVEGATGPNHQFVARKDTILYSWRLIVSTDE